MLNKILKFYENIKKIAFYDYNIKRSRLIRFIRIVAFSYENYKKTRSDLWTSSLTYFSLLSIVPILAIAYSIAKGFGVDSLIKGEIIRNSPLEPEALERLLGFSEKLLDNARGGIIAGAGFIFLSWSVMKIFTLVERSFNEIWMVDRGRSFIRKFTDYFSIIILLPIVVLLSNGISDWAKGYFLKEGSALEVIFNVTPYILLALFFTMIYYIIPNTNVRLDSAFVAGFFAMLLFEGAQGLVMKSQVFLLGYNKVYGSFSIVPIFIVWQKIVWVITILGAHLSFVIQNSYKFDYTLGESRVSIKSKREAVFLTSYLFVENYRLESKGISIEDIGKRLFISIREASSVVGILIDTGIIVEVTTINEERRFKLNKNIDTFTLEELINLFEGSGYSVALGDDELKVILKKINHLYNSKRWNILIKNLDEEEDNERN